MDVPSDQNIFFVISARISRGAKNCAYLYIQDKTEGWERSSIVINQHLWRDYVVAKEIRNDATDICLGVNWSPSSADEWLEIRSVRMYVGKGEITR